MSVAGLVRNTLRMPTRKLSQRTRQQRLARHMLVESLESRQLLASDFGFAHALGGTSTDIARTVAVDNAGNTYVAGEFRGAFDIDPGPAILRLAEQGAGSGDVFIAKFAPDGTLAWAKSVGGTSVDTVADIAVDGDGNVVVAGKFGTSIDIDPGPSVNTLFASPGGSTDIFVLKLDNAGNYVWGKSFGSTTGGENIQGLTVDVAGNIYTTGQFNGSGNFATGAASALILSTSSTNDWDVFVSKLDAAGNAIWARNFGAANSATGDEGTDIAVDHDGFVYTSGRFRGDSSLSRGTATGHALPFNSGSIFSDNIFVTKHDATGNLVWAKGMLGTAPSSASALALDNAGHLYVGGSFQGTVDFDPSAAGVFSLTDDGNFDAFVTKLDDAGNFVWARRWGNTVSTSLNDLTVNAEGLVFSTGQFGGTMDFNPLGGVFNLTSAGSVDIYVSTLDADGQLVDALRMGGTGLDRAFGIAVRNDDIHTVGEFGGTADFDPGAGVRIRTAVEGQDGFLSKLGPPQPLLPGSITGQKWNDQNANGVRDANESPLASVVIYLDLNNNGLLDGGQANPTEPFTLTDAEGNYRFENLAPGDYLVREIVPDGYMQTSPGAQRDYYLAYDAGNNHLIEIDALSGVVQRTPLNMPGGADLHGVIATRTGEIYGLDANSRTLYSVDRVTGLATARGSANISLGRGLAYDPATDTIYGIGLSAAGSGLVIFNRDDGQVTPWGTPIPSAQLQLPGGLTFDRTTKNVVVYDQSGSDFWAFDSTGVPMPLGTRSMGSPSLAHDGVSLVTLAGSFSSQLIRFVPSGSSALLLNLSQPISIEALEFIKATPFAYNITVASGAAVTDVNFGNQFVLGEIHGAKWNDANGDGTWNATESPLPGLTVYLDLNNDGQLQENEPSTTTDADGAYQFSGVRPGMHLVREIVPENYRQTSPGAQADFYYAIDAFRNAQLVKVNSITGAVTRIGTGTGVQLAGIALTSYGELYGITGGTNSQLYQIDLQTGVATLIGAAGRQLGGGLAYDAETDTLYTVARDPANNAFGLATIDRASGIATPVGPGAFNLNLPIGVAFNSLTKQIVVLDASDRELIAFTRAGVASTLGFASANSSSLTHSGTDLIVFDSNRVFAAIQPNGSRSTLTVAAEDMLLTTIEYVNLEPFANTVFVAPAAMVTGVNFGNQFVLADIRGTQWNDQNGNGTRDPGEPGMAGVTVYLDLNNNGLLDEGETTAVTAADGSYEFTDVSPGNYFVREVVPVDYQQTAPGVQPDFFYAVRARRELIKVDPLSGQVTFVGFISQQTDFHGLVRTNSGELFALSGQENTLWKVDPDTAIGTRIGATGKPVAWGLAYDAATDTIFGLAVPDGNSNFISLVSYDRETGRVTVLGPGVSGLQGVSGITFDPINNRIIAFDNFDRELYAFTPSGTATRLANMTLGTAALATDAQGRVVFESGSRLYTVNPDTGITSPLNNIFPFFIDALEFVNNPDFARQVFVSPATDVEGVDFGNQYTRADIRGTKWNDQNGNGTRDPGEPGMAGVTVYLDLNNNGVLDEGENTAITAPDGSYEFTEVRPGNYFVREIVPAGYQQTAPGVQSDFYYAVRFGRELTKIDPATGQPTFIGVISPQTTFHGLVRTNAGELFAISGPESTLWKVDPVTGAGTRIGAAGKRIAYGLAYDANTDTIYGLAHPDGNTTTISLATYDRTTGLVTVVGPAVTGLQGVSGITFDPINNRIIAIDNFDREFYAFSPSGAATRLATMQFSTAALATDAQGRVVFESSSRLYAVDPNTGTVTPLNNTFSYYIDALEYVNHYDFARQVFVAPATDVEGVDFGNEYVAGEIRGTKWNDLDQDGARDADEPGLAGVQIYLDMNLSGALESGEPVTVTAADGSYAFTEVMPGTYVVREMVPDAYVQTAPGASPDYLYGLNNGQELVRIDADTGLVTTIGFANAGPNLHGIVRTNSGELFAVSGWTNSLYSINPANGQATLIGPAGRAIGWGLAYDPITDTLYGLGHTTADQSTISLVTFDRTTGATTVMGAGYANIEYTSGLTFDLANQRIVAFDNDGRGQFWGFDRQGNAALLGEAPNLTGNWSLASTAQGQMVMKSGNQLVLVDLTTVTAPIITPLATLSRALTLEGLEYIDLPDFAYEVVVGKREIVAGRDFGNVNPAPTLTTLEVNQTTIDENGSISLAGSFLDVGQEARTVEINWGDGNLQTLTLAGDARSFAADHQYLDDGDYRVQVRVIDSAGNRHASVDTSAPDSIVSPEISVLNVAPQITSLNTSALLANAAEQCQAVTINGEFTEVGTLDTHLVSIDWGDGHTSVVSLALGARDFADSHVYEHGGIYNVTVTLVDDDHGADTATAQSVVEGFGVVDGVLYIIGTSANDYVSIHQSDTDSNPLIRVNASFVEGCTDDDNDLTAPGRFDLASINQIVAYLGAGDDHANIAGNVALPVFIDGGAGNDHLHGGAGSNLLLGGAGDDYLYGGGLRDLLIGGSGADHLYGKPADDLLIAGTTAFDDDFDVLAALMAEWNSSRSYVARVANLTDGTGSSTRFNGDNFLRADGPDATVFDDNAQDHLHGASGLDWFFASLEEDLIDEKNDELVEDLL